MAIEGLGTIIVEKQTIPDGAPDLFTFGGDAAGQISDGQQIVVTNLPAGTYTSTETVPAGWRLTSIVCDDANSSGDKSTGIITFQLEAGETVKAVFTNVKEQDGGKPISGTGTWTAIATAVMLGAVALLILRRRYGRLIL